MPTSRASRLPTSGPAPPKATSAKSRGSTPARERILVKAAYMFETATRTTLSAASCRLMPSGSAKRRDRLLGERAVERASARRGIARGRGSRRPGRRRRAWRPCRRGRSRPGPGLAPVLCGPDLGHADLVDPGDRAAAGADGGDAHHRHHHRDAADLLARCCSAGRPSSTTAISALVPPTSSVIRLPRPAAVAT